MRGDTPRKLGAKMQDEENSREIVPCLFEKLCADS